MGRIIKETASHNAALLAKEAAEAQARLDNLTEAEDKKRRKLNPSTTDIRRRQLGDISSILLGRKRKRSGDEKDEMSRSKDASSAGDKEYKRPESDRRKKEGRHRSDKEDEDRTRDQQSHGRDREEPRARKDRRHRERSRSPASEPRRHRHRSPLSSDDVDHDDRRRRSRRSEKDHERSGGDLIQKELLRRKRHGRLTADDDPARGTPEKQSRFERPSSTRGRKLADDDGSDPLEDLIGPAPPPQSPVQRRGRGAGRGPAAMDSRFSEAYDPQSDAQPEPEDAGDWDEAVEVFRDRQKWKQQGADRLRAAGFTDEDIKKWEKGGERDIDDVRWTKAGEKREWDRGKDESS